MTSREVLLSLVLLVFYCADAVQGFQTPNYARRPSLSFKLYSDSSTSGAAAPLELKQDLLDLIAEDNAPAIQTTIQQLEYFDSTGDVMGTWELLWCSSDGTRSSPFFQAFSQAYDNADQIYGITDSIPAPLKEIGTATQEITENSLVSRVKVATLGGKATSVMTTRCSILQNDSNKLTLGVESTKPEDSTILKKLGPLGSFLNENLPPFPSGMVLERVTPGSSKVVQSNTYVDDTIRVSRYENPSGPIYCIWKRTRFSSLDF